MPQLLDLPPNELHLWFTPYREVDEASLLRRYVGLLDADEDARRRRFRFERDQTSYAVSHALLRMTLSQYAATPPEDWRFVAGPQGRPEIRLPDDHGGLRFNLSHTRGGALVGVVRRHDVGVDLESMERTNDCDALAERYFAPAEVHALRALAEVPRRTAFFDVWTLKEAYVKARGLGLHLPLDQFAYTLRDGTAAIAFEPQLNDDPQAWQFALWQPAAEFRGAVAVRCGSAGPLRITARQVLPLVHIGAPTVIAG